MTPAIAIALLIATLFTGCASHMPPTPVDARPIGRDDASGATAANILYVPFRGLICGATAVLSGAVMLVTLGQSYDAASELMHGGCSGPWVLTPHDIRQAVP